jgi:mRNA-degrading endonuclease toxin of MazEF toxin-antitoxin module
MINPKAVIDKFMQWSVWYLFDEEGEEIKRDPYHHENKAGVLRGNRPVVIISNNTFNNTYNNPVVNVLKMSSTLSAHSPTHVKVSLDGKNQSDILCEQVETVRKDRLKHYKGQLPDCVVKDVQKAMLYQYNFVPETELTGEVLTSVQKFVDGYILQRSVEFETRLKEVQIPQLLNDAVKTMDDMFVGIMDSLKNIKTPEIEEMKPVSPKAVEKVVDSVDKTKKHKTGPSAKISDEDKVWCVANYKAGNTEAIYQKYGWTKSTLVSNVSRFKKYLAESEVGANA